ncbi:STAS domain-containing protein [Streptomyces sp. NPDC085529]|uniref:STAS domain-containing protein n=1 Tax=Streptomyces sp. NPDC085529 TaxID=3365729 RepID=UPI0037CF40D3
MSESQGFAEEGIPQGFLAVGPHTYRSPTGVAHVTRDDSAPAGTLLLNVTGEFDRDTLPCLRDALGDVDGEQRECVLLDLSGVTFGDSSFLNELLETHRRAARLVVVGPFTGQIRRLFELTGADRVLEIAEDRDSVGIT